jgi:hypothetical protein
MLPADPQPRQGPADAAQADPLPVRLTQVLPQQGRRPYRRVVAVISGIRINDFINPRINDSLHGCRPTAPGRIHNPLGGREPKPLLEVADPVVNALAGNAQVLRHFLHTLALIQQHQGQSTLILPGLNAQRQQALQFAPLLGI